MNPSGNAPTKAGHKTVLRKTVYSNWVVLLIGHPKFGQIWVAHFLATFYPNFIFVTGVGTPCSKDGHQHTFSFQAQK